MNIEKVEKEAKKTTIKMKTEFIPQVNNIE